MTGLPEGTKLVSVPWPIRLFGDLQEPLGLPVVTAAVDLRVAVGVMPIESGPCRASAPWHDDPVSFDPARPGDLPDTFQPLVAALNVLRDTGALPSQRVDLRLHSRAPEIGDLWRSPAVTCAWTVAVLSAGGNLRERSGAAIARLVEQAWEARTDAGDPPPELRTCILGGTLIARGEVVESNGKFGLRLIDVVSPAERLKKLK